MSNLGKRVGLVHELRERVGAEERAYNARDCLGVDKVCRLEHLVVTHVHALADCAAHTCQTDRELVAELLAYCTYAAVREVVDIINSCIRVNQLDEIADDGDDILLCKNACLRVDVETELLVDAVATYLAEVVALVREEYVLEHLACRCVISRVSVAELTVDVKHSLLLRVRGVFSESVEND